MRAAVVVAMLVMAVPGRAFADDVSTALGDRPLDGYANNVAHPTWGEAGFPYLRVTPAVYADGLAAPLSGPPARYVSNRIFADGAQNIFSENAVTQWGWVWGQFIDHTIGLRLDDGGEHAPIAFNASDPLETFRNDFGVIDFSRTPAAPGTGTGGVPREQTNTESSYIDASAVYSDSSSRLSWLRDGAKLKLDSDGNLPRRGDDASAPNMELDGRLVGQGSKAMVAGDPRANENLSLTATQTLFVREHNRIVDALPASLPEEEKFQIARRVVSAEQQYITYNEFLPDLGVKLSPYRGYDPAVNATLGNEFATVGYRAHSMIHGEIEPAGTWPEATLDSFEAQGIEVEGVAGAAHLGIPLNLTFGNPDLLAQLGVGPVLQALGNESEYRNDELIDNQLRSVLFQVPKPGTAATCLDGTTLPDCFSGVVDLGALDIERGRDHGIPHYNDLRRALGLAPKTSFTAITGESSEDLGGLSVDDPHIMDVTGLRDIHGAELPFPSEEGAASVVRRTTVAARLKAIYGDVDKLDAFTGMLAERHVLGTEFGELQLAMWKRQFEALRDGDRFFYLNDPALALIERDFGISARRSLAQVIRDNTGQVVRDDVFKLDGAPSYSPADGGVGSTVAATLSLSLGTPAAFGAFAPGVAHDYVAGTTANVISTAGDAALNVSDPGHLMNGTFAMAQPLRVDIAPGTWDGPVANAPVTITFRQRVEATDPLRTGSYARALTFTLSTTAP